jgi:hypothetical protein
VDERATTPVVGKALEVAVLVVFIGLVSAALFGSVVPTYRTAAGAEVGDRVLISAVGQVDVAADVPESVETRRVTISIPRTIRGSSYILRTDEVNGTPTLVLDHPASRIGGVRPLSLPAAVTTVDGELRSTATPTVVVSRQQNGTLAVVLQ